MFEYLFAIVLFLNLYFLLHFLFLILSSDFIISIHSLRYLNHFGFVTNLFLVKDFPPTFVNFVHFLNVLLISSTTKLHCFAFDLKSNSTDQSFF